jgi:hypothetical protein
MRSSSTLTPEELRAQAVIDAAINGGDVQPEDAALTDFALLIRSARPVPSHSEALAIEERVQRSKVKGRKSRFSSPQIAFAAAAVLLVATVGPFVLSTGSADKAMSSFGDDSADSAAPAIAPATAPEQEFSKKAMDSSESSLGQKAAATGERKVSRQTEMVLATGADDIDSVSDQIISTTDRHSGYVANSSVHTDGESGSATFSLMIPTGEYDSALADLSKLGHVRSRSQSMEDITRDYNAAERSVAARRVQVARLEEQLKGTSGAQRVAIESDLARAKARLASALRNSRVQRTRANYVPMSIQLVADDSAATAGKGAIGKAVHWAGQALTAIAAVLIVVLAVALPFALFAALIWFGWRRAKRGRADRTINAATAQAE